MGCANAEATGEEANENNCKDVIGEKFAFEELKSEEDKEEAGEEAKADEKHIDLETFTEKFGELLAPTPPEAFTSEAGEDLLAIAEEGCKFTKSYPIKSNCRGQYLYLIRDGANNVKELCVTDLTNPEI
jgi:hypothetical protein